MINKSQKKKHFLKTTDGYHFSPLCAMKYQQLYNTIYKNKKIINNMRDYLKRKSKNFIGH